MTCETGRGLLAADAAGALDPMDRRSLDEHLRNCAACAEEAVIFNAIAAGLAGIPAPVPPTGLVYRTQMLMAVEADRRQGIRLALGAGVFAWLLFIAAWQTASLLGAGGVWFWMFWCAAAAGTGAASAAALARRTIRAGRPQ